MAVLLFAVTGCQSDNPQFCCSTAASCSAAGTDEVIHCADPDRPICDDDGELGPRFTCVGAECELSADCGSNEPVCDDGTCRRCTADDECDSEVCDEASGRCVAEGAVLYVATTGDDGGDCTAASPCATLAHALTKVDDAHRIVRLREGQYDESIVLEGTAVELAGSGATLVGVSTDPALYITGGSDLAIDGLTVIAGAPAVLCGQSSVTVHGGALRSSGMRAIDATTCVIRLERASLTDGVVALVAMDSDVEITRSVVRRNNGGGVDLSGGSFTITNTVIANNGSSTSGLGGIRLSNVDPTAARVFAFNTVTGNDTGGTGPSGVQCLNMSTAPELVSNIVHGNVDEDASADACTWRASDVGGEPAGQGNVDVDPGFADGEFHLRNDSPLVDSGAPMDGVDVDRDGDPRPSGSAPDIGADEVVP